MSDEQLTAKFLECSRISIGDHDSRALINLIDEIELLDNFEVFKGILFLK